MRTEITDVLTGAGRALMERDAIDAMEIVQAHDIHAFYRRGNSVVHIQAYPGFSTAQHMVAMGRRMRYDSIIALRASGTRPGNEHDAVEEDGFGQQRMPYDAAMLQDRVENIFPKPRLRAVDE